MTSLDDDFTELIDADIPRVDLVDKAANGTRFLIAKQADGAGLMDPTFVRELLAKSEPDHDSKETVTMTGSPGAIAKMIHEAGRRAASTDPVAKELELDDSPDGMDTDVILAAPEGEAPGSPTDPGSPAWEAVDAATARKWTSILARAKVAIDMLADRETLEAAAGDEDDMDNVFDLQDACCAIDYAISVLAPFAVDEQSEADCGDMMQMVGKALAGFDPAPLDTIEALGQVRKAGRVLSTANEAAIRGAVDSLQKVLASLPAAPTAPEDGQSVAKEQETDMPETTPPEDLAAEPVGKADGEKTSVTVVYDQTGRLIGIVDPSDITPVSNSETSPEDAGDDTDAPEAAPAAAPDASDLTPAPAAEVGTPADATDDGVAKTTTDTDMFKSIAEDKVTAALDAYSATQEQIIAKQADDLAQMADIVELLKSRVQALEEQPAVPKVLTNGALPPAHLMRGQDAGAASIDVAKAQELKKSLRDSTDAVQQRDIALQMQQQARFAFDQLQSRG